MNNEAMNPFINRVDDWENRIDTTEDQKGKKGRWLKDKVYKAGSIMGLLVGIPGALVGAVNFWDWINAKPAEPKIEHKLDRDIKLSLAQDGRLYLQCALILSNIGNAKDIVKVTHAYVISHTLGIRERFNLEDISVSEKGAPIPDSINVKAEERYRVDITGSSKLTLDKQRIFLETGFHEFVLELNFQESEKSPKETYCFFVATDDVKSLRKNVTKNYSDKVQGCPSGGQ